MTVAVREHPPASRYQAVHTGTVYAGARECIFSMSLNPDFAEEKVSGRNGIRTSCFSTQTTETSNREDRFSRPDCHLFLLSSLHPTPPHFPHSRGAHQDWKIRIERVHLWVPSPLPLAAIPTQHIWHPGKYFPFFLKEGNRDQERKQK